MESKDLTPDDFDDELYEEPVPSPEAIAIHRGKVIAYDSKGQIREATDTWGEMLKRLGPKLEELTLMYVPVGALIG